MRAIFCHDLPIYKDINGVYCSTTLTDSMFQRFFVVADELIVSTRVYQLNKTYAEAHQEPITLDKVKILAVPNMMSARGMIFQRGPFKKVMSETLKDVDLVFLRGGECATVAYEVCREMNKPYLSECGGISWETFWHHSFLGKFVAPRMELKSIQIIKHAHYVAYVTEKYLQKRYPTKGISTHASNVYLKEVDPETLKMRKARIATRKKQDSVVIGTTAAVNVKYKGQEYIIRALARLKKLGYKVRYELVGGGDQSFLKKIAEKYDVSDAVHFWGEKTHDEVLNWLDSIDIYAQPSRQEGLPRALVEAMSRSCPSIGSTTAGIPELIDSNVVFNNGNVRQITEVLSKIIDGVPGYDMSVLAEHNFNKACEYEYKKIEERRTALFKQYAEYVQTNTKR